LTSKLPIETVYVKSHQIILLAKDSHLFSTVPQKYVRISFSNRNLALKPKPPREKEKEQAVV